MPIFSLASTRVVVPPRAAGGRADGARPRVAARAARDASTSDGRRAILAGTAAFLTGRAAAAWADLDEDMPPKDYSSYNSGGGAGGEQSELVKKLLARSAENKAKNDAERFDYDSQYASSLAIIKGTGYVPDDKTSREKLGITRPPECDLPFFKDSSTCAKF